MNYRLRDLPTMLATKGGRLQVRNGIRYRLFPLLSRLAWLYRRTFMRRARVVVVVGSFGKSTTARATTVALGMTPHPRITANAFYSVTEAMFRVKPSQPRAVIEVGIGGPGEMGPYARMTRPDVVVATSIGSEGRLTLETLENTRAEKSLMLKALDSSGVAVVNGDDPNVMWMAEQTEARVFTYGFGPHCRVRASDFRLQWPHESQFRLTAFGEEREVAIRLFGRHMVYPALAAWSLWSWTTEWPFCAMTSSPP